MPQATVYLLEIGKHWSAPLIQEIHGNLPSALADCKLRSGIVLGQKPADEPLLADRPDIDLYGENEELWATVKEKRVIN